jgi:hypothetical protein
MRSGPIGSALVLPRLLSPAFGQDPSKTPTSAVLEGTVVNSVTDGPIAAARIRLAPCMGADSAYTKTDEQGHFQFASLPVGCYMLAADRPGFTDPAASTIGTGSSISMSPAVLDIHNGLAGPRPVSRDPGGRLSERFTESADGTLHATVTIKLVPSAVVTGRITDPGGLPCVACVLEVLAERPAGSTPASPPDRRLPDGANEVVPSRQTQIDDRGEFRILLQPGKYYFVANKTGGMVPWDRSYRVTYYPHAVDLASAKPVNLAAGQQMRVDIQIVRQTGFKVAGRLIFPPDPPRSAAKFRYTNLVLVTQQNYLDNPNGPFTMAQDDRYEFGQVLPGKYVLTALTRDVVASTNLASDQHPVFGLVRSIEVGDRDLEDVDLELQPLSELTGTVTFATGCTAEPVRIRVSGSNPVSHTHADVVSGTDGSFVLSGLTPGHLTISITPVQNAVPTGFSSAVRAGTRDLLKDGFDFPLQSNEPLQVTVNCGKTRRPQ